MAEKIDVKVASLGLGLGGSNLAQALKSRLGGKIGVINLSKQDLATANIEDKADALLLDSGGSGAGKNRGEGGKYWGRSIDAISELVFRIAEGADILFACSSTAGGTGSGLIPRVLAYLFTKEFEEHFTSQGKKAPVVFAVAMTPDFEEGVKSLTNTLDCLEDFKLLFDKKGAGRYILVNNEFGRNELNQAAKFTRINEAVAGILHRYLMTCGSAREGVLDRADRFAALGTPGIHSFFYFDDKGRHDSPFIQPEGARVMQLAAEIPEGQVLSQHIERFGLTVDDTMPGYFSKEDNLAPIIHLAGFNNWGKLTERFRNQLELRKARAAETQDVNNNQGLGLADVKRQREFVVKEYSAKSIADVNEISDIFDK